mmetsp:Transcript_26454/g.63482  ORF Transcript_26454/g.63482 Transcript_26454/m.63482 type:complete len:892 (-) Transcript_26454:264-2939(-)
MGAKSKSKVKKGPKGKKARAKAKLEQVWGEAFDEDVRKASRVRAGKSRTPGKKVEDAVDPLSNRRRGVATTFDKFLDRKEKYDSGVQQRQRHFYHERKNRKEDQYASSDESSGEDDSDDDTNELNGGSFSTLLKRISGPKKSQREIALDSDDDASDSDEDSAESDSESNSSEESKDSDAEMDGSGDDISEDEFSSKDEERQQEVLDNQQKNSPSAVNDPYEAHFSKPPLPQLDSLQSVQMVPLTGNDRKVPTASITNSSVDVHMSGALLESWDLAMANSTCGDNTAPNNEKPPKKKQGNIHAKNVWGDFASAPYQHVREVLARNWKSFNKPVLKRSSMGTEDEASDDGPGKLFSSFQSVMYPGLSRYADVLVTSESRQNRNEVDSILSMHILNHVLTSRTRVQRHNRRIKELTNSDDNTAKHELTDEGDDKWRDQGYTRPKVLILLPTRGTCWQIVQKMIQLLGDAAIVDNGDRFDNEYGPLNPGDADDSDDEDDNAKARRAAVLKQKGVEWNELFGDDVNNDDDFKMGMSLTPNVVKSAGKKKTKHAGYTGASGVNMKLFADFYRSDIILASPIALQMATSGNEDGEDDEDEADVDFLSSIDICLVARGDVLLMQNWDHVNGILNSLNQQPKKITDIDFSRVRNYFLEGQGAHWRQLIVVSQFTDPYILSTYRRHAKNIEGQLKIRQKVSTDDASICDVMVRVKQVFQRVSCQTVSEARANRLRYFSDNILPKLIRLKQRHTLIYIPSYFDFIAVRNLLLKSEADFVSVTEYARVSEVSRGRARFLQGRKSIMLYTGRAHFFLRHKIKGARHVIFFGLPEHSEFYPAVVNMFIEELSSVDGDDDVDISRMPMSCLSLFTKFDAHQLERIVGLSHAMRMIKAEKSSYMFCS